MLPAFDYLSPAIDRSPTSRFTDDHRAYVQAMSDSDLEVFTWAYNEINRRQDATRLCNWVEQNSASGHTSAAVRLFHLFLIFDLLADKGIAPFAARSVEYLPDSKPVDWQKLPPDLRFLATVAERFGPTRSREQISRFVSALDPQQMNELRATSERLRKNELASNLYDWLEEHPAPKHPENNLLVNLIDIMNAANCSIDDPPDEQMLHAAWLTAKPLQAATPSVSRCPICKVELPSADATSCPSCGLSWDER